MTQPKFFQLFKNNENIEEGISDDFINVLKECNNPHIVCIYGDARMGKSTKMNQLIQGIKANNYFNLDGPFKTLLQIHTTQTKGCNFYGPIKIKDIIERNDLDINELEGNVSGEEDLFFVDTEGLKTIDNMTKTCVAGILTILQIAAVKILYIPLLDNEKLEEAAKNTKLSAILKIFENRSEIIVLIRDVPLEEDKNLRKMRSEIEEQKGNFEEKINNFFRKINADKGKCEILPSFDLAKQNIGDFPQCYKEQMQSLVSTIISNVTKNQNISGTKLIDIIKELLEIFKQVENIETMRNTDNALNSILLKTFKQKIKKMCKIISEKINNFDKDILKLASDEEIKKYIIDYLKNELKESWNIYFDSIKNDVENEIDKARLEIKTDIISGLSNIKKNVEEEMKTFINNLLNKDLSQFLSKFHFREEINKNELNKMIDNQINSFFNKNKKYFDCFDIQYKNDTEKYLKETIKDIYVKYRIESMNKWSNYLINVIEDIKKNVSIPYLNDYIKANKEEIKTQLNNDLVTLKQKLQIYLAQKNIKVYDKNEFQKQLDEIYKEIKNTFTERVKSIELGETIEKFKKERIYNKTIIDGIYIIRPMISPNKCIKLENNGPEISDFNNEKRQKYNIKYDPNNKYYSIQCIADDCPKYLTCDDINIYTHDKSHDKNQQWHIVISEDNNYEIICDKNNNYMNVEEGSNKIICKEKNGKINQRFNFESTIKTPPPPPPKPPEPPKASEPPRPPERYFPIPNFHHPYTNQVSIVDALKSVGADSSKGYRRAIGDRNGIPGAPYSPSYNTHMLNLMKQGRLIIP